MTMTLADLKLLPQWVGYTAAKVPMNPHNGRAAASNNPDTWGTAAQAWAAKKRHNWAGVGYVFTIAAGVVGVDLDDCFDADGRLSDEARQIVQMLNSYTERSPSGTGLHILARGSIPHSIKTPTFEMYNELRYFTVTGRQFGASFVSMASASSPLVLARSALTSASDFSEEPSLIRWVSASFDLPRLSMKASPPDTISFQYGLVRLR